MQSYLVPCILTAFSLVGMGGFPCEVGTPLKTCDAWKNHLEFLTRGDHAILKNEQHLASSIEEGGVCELTSVGECKTLSANLHQQSADAGEMQGYAPAKAFSISACRPQLCSFALLLTELINRCGDCRSNKLPLQNQHDNVSFDGTKPLSDDDASGILLSLDEIKV